MTNALAAPHLIFDFDGTLVDSGPAILRTLGLVLEAQGLVPQLPLDDSIIGPPLPVTLAKLAGSKDPELIDTLTTDFKARYDADGVYATALYPGVADALIGLAASGRRLFLATNKRERPTLLLLEHFQLREVFSAVYCLDSRTPAFADKGSMLRVLMAEQGLTSVGSAYIGDTNHDEAAAAFAGLPFIAVKWGYGVGAQQVSAPVVRIATMQALLVP